MKKKRWNQLGWAVLSVCITIKLVSYYMNFLEFNGRLSNLAQCNAVIDGLLLLAILLPSSKRIIAVPFLIVLSGLFFSVSDFILGRAISSYDIEILINAVVTASLIVFCWKKGNAQLSSDDVYLKAE